MIRGEHDPARGGDDVEARVLVLHLLGVPDLELDGEIAIDGKLPGGVDQDRGKIHADDVGAALGEEKRDRAGAGRGVEHLLAGLRIQPLDDKRVEVTERVRDALIRAVPPHDALPSLQLCECHCSSFSDDSAA